MRLLLDHWPLFSGTYITAILSARSAWLLKLKGVLVCTEGLAPAKYKSLTSVITDVNFWEIFRFLAWMPKNQRES
jgi:hypothetical protein